MILGTIVEVTDGSGLSLLIDGEETPTEKDYMFLSSYSPAVDDRVLIEEISDTYVVLGSLTDTKGEASVPYAERAGYANTAGSATSASSATKATNDANGNSLANKATAVVYTAPANYYAQQGAIKLNNAAGTQVSTTNLKVVAIAYKLYSAGSTSVIFFRVNNSMQLQYGIGTESSAPTTWKTITTS